MSTPLPGALVRMLIALAALAGALLSAGAFRSKDEAPAPQAPAPVATAAPPSALQRALPPVAAQLVDARRSGRKALAAARTPESQNAAAGALADAYQHAAVRLGKPAREAGETAVLAALDRVSRAYRRLATAARAHDRAAYKSARAAIAAAERKLPGAFSAVLTNAS